METLEQTRRITGIYSVPTCPYCGEHLTSNDFDPGVDCDGTYEPGFYTSHMRCVWPSASGRYTVVKNGEPMGAGSTYTTLARARQGADDFAAWNPIYPAGTFGVIDNLTGKAV